MTPKVKALDEYDISIGGRVRIARRSRRISQASLARALGIRAQQVQKYESGATRISAAGLVRISRILGVEPATFLHFTDRESEPSSIFDLNPESLELLDLMARIRPKVRRAFLSLGRELTGEA